MSRRRFLTSVIAALYFGALVGLTFVPTTEQARASWLLPVTVFVPVGLLLVLLMGPRRWWAALAFSLLGAAWIEAAQSIWMPVGYAQASDGSPSAPLGSHVNPHTAGGIAEGGYLGFAELQYAHLPLPGETLVAFLSDGAAEEQRGSDWMPRWWRAS